MATRCQQFEILAAGVLYDGATITTPYVKFLAAGTSTAKDAYADINKSIAITKKALDSQGRATVYGDGIYKLIFYSGDPDAGGVLKFELDNQKVTAVSGNARTITSNTTGTRDDGFIIADTTGGNITYILPSAADYPIDRPLTVKKVAAGNILTYSAAGSETIDGNPSGTLSDNNATIQFLSNGTNWFGAQIVGTAATLGGYSADTGTTAETIPVRNAAGLLPFRGALVYNTTGGATPTFTSESYDTDAIHDNSTNPGRLTVPTGVTKVKVSAQLLMVSGDAIATVFILKNGAALIGEAVSSGRLSTGHIGTFVMSAHSPVCTVSAGDYFTVGTSGINAAADATGNSSWFSMELIE